jgi:hypothetical protein
MIHRGPGFLEVVGFGSSPTISPLSRQHVVSLSQSSWLSPVELTDGRAGEGGGRGAKSYDHDNAWPPINHATPSGLERLTANANVATVLGSIPLPASSGTLASGGPADEPSQQ